MRSARIGAVLLAALLAGPARAVDPPVLSPGVVFVVGGVGGFDHVGKAALKALPEAGVRHEIHDFIWTHGWGHMLKDLQDTEHMTRKAAELASKVRRYRNLYPDRPIFLIGKSGGAGLVLRAAEMLPPDTLDRIILLSAAVAPTYDLRPAFRATKYEIVSFYSNYDWFILGWGTWQFGTADRVYVASAGLRGFQRPPQNVSDARLYRRLVEIPWSPAMIPEGYVGGHVGTSSSAFVAKEVAPWLKH